MIEKMLNSFGHARWFTFNFRFRVSYNWLEAYKGWKASFRSAFKVKQLSSFPPNENPFWHDSYHTGVSLGRNVMAMNSLGNIDDKDIDYIILVHRPTGQRIQVNFRKGESNASSLSSQTEGWR